MVAFSTMGWLAGMTDNIKRSISSSDVSSHTKQTNLGILAFETAKIMSRILSLYNSLSDEEVSVLKKEVVRSEGVAYLNSKDDGFLLGLACAERLEDLDLAAFAVARLGRKCSDFGLNRFEMVYTDLKLGTINIVGKMEYGSKALEKRVHRMEKLISETSGLYSSLEALAEMEASERKFMQWKKNGGSSSTTDMNFDVFNQKINYQRKLVRRYKEASLWSQTFDTVVGLMARTVCAIYTRICSVFRSYVPALPATPVTKRREATQNELRGADPIKEQICSRSGPIISDKKPILVRFYSQKLVLSDDWRAGGGRDKGGVKNNYVFHSAGPDTVGGSGLAIRYANLVLLVERYLDAGRTIGNVARENLYEMLPENLKALVRSKLCKHVWRIDRNDESLAEGWREPLLGILAWLLPLAQDTLKWQMERNFEKTKFETKPTVLLLQTLHFANKEKTEAAIAELLVGLSCIYLYENRGLPPES